jgi:HlyD family secretion protein
MTLPSSDPAHSESPMVAHADTGSLPNLTALKQGLSTAGRSSALPRSRRNQKRLRVVISTAAIVVVICVTGIGYLFHGAHARANLITARVEYKDLQFKVVERGSLEARENHDIKCEVKAGSRGAGKIKSVVENGALVQKGDLLVEIDDSYLQEQALAKKIDRQKALADKIAAEQLYPVKKIGVALAKRQLEQWVKGDFPQQLHELEGEILVNESAVLQQEDRTAWAGRMVRKGYMTASQLEAEQANLKANKLTLQKFREQKKVLVQFTDPVQRQTLRNAITQAEVDERTAYANMQSTDAIFKQHDHFYQDLVAQIALCKVKAPCDGIVVYAVPEQTRRGAGSSPSIIAQGEPVQAGQKMMSIPDLSHMLLKVNIHEAFINRLKPGLPVKVRVDALPDKALTAKVKYLANVAAPTDWMSPDVKVYESLVEIDDYPSDLRLKPGLSAVCTIFTERHADHVLAVPVQAVLDPLEKGGHSRCYVAISEGGAQMREIELGLSDDKYVEVKSGLNEGDEIILNPIVLESEKEKNSGPIGDVPAASR